MKVKYRKQIAWVDKNVIRHRDGTLNLWAIVLLYLIAIPIMAGFDVIASSRELIINAGSGVMSALGEIFSWLYIF